MKTFLITLLASTAITIACWQFGLGAKIWPAHPFLAALAAAIVFGIAIQWFFSSKGTWDQK